MIGKHVEVAYHPSNVAYYIGEHTGLKEHADRYYNTFIFSSRMKITVADSASRSYYPVESIDIFLCSARVLQVPQLEPVRASASIDLVLSNAIENASDPVGDDHHEERDVKEPHHQVGLLANNKYLKGLHQLGHLNKAQESEQPQVAGHSNHANELG
jgi:hypothetical protein